MGINLQPVPVPAPVTGLRALRAILRQGHPLAALEIFRRELGDVFRINLPGFSPVVMVGAQAARFILVEERNELRWRMEGDPVTDLLRHGVLVEDGAAHDKLRQGMNPALHRRMLEGYLQAMYAAVDQVSSQWRSGSVVDMLVEMRKIALLILVRTLFRADFSTELEHLWRAVLDCIQYISPGMWMIWRSAPRWRYRRGMRQMDEYLYRLIAERRRILEGSDPAPDDLLGMLLASGMDDGLVRDQLLTMLIAGHDTSTALLAWTMYLLGSHTAIYRQVCEELEALPPGGGWDVETLNGLPMLGNAIQEALRLYPPIHLGSRQAARDLQFQGYHIPAGERVIYSIYLTQRHPDYWDQPDAFIPQRHAAGVKPVPYAWLAFGGGPRNCMGAAYGQVESRLVLAQVLKQFEVKLVEQGVRPHMGATLEPHPGVRMRLWRKAGN